MKLKGKTQLAIFLVIFALLTISCNLIDNLAEVELNRYSNDETSQQEEPENPNPDPTSEPTAAPTATPTVEPTPTIEPTTKPPRATATPEETDNCLSEDIGFHIELPETWICLNLTETEYEEIFSNTLELNPELGETLSVEYMANLIESGVKLFAISYDNLSSPKGLYSTVNILVVDFPIGMTLADYVDLSVHQLHELFGEGISIYHELVQIGELEAAKITYEAVMNDSTGNPYNLAFLQYILIEENILYVLSFGSPASDYNQMEPVFVDIAQSFRITE